jgi:hypothetical protein
LPFESLTDVVTVTVYCVDPLWPLVANTAWLLEQLVNDHPPALMVILVVLTVEQSTFSLQLIVTGMLAVTSGAPFEGLVLLTVGRVVSTTTVLGVANTADTLPIASLAQGYRVYVPSEPTVYVAGAVPDHPPPPAGGGVAEVVI